MRQLLHLLKNLRIRHLLNLYNHLLNAFKLTHKSIRLVRVFLCNICALNNSKNNFFLPRNIF